jgi:hypothetical protein
LKVLSWIIGIPTFIGLIGFIFYYIYRVIAANRNKGILLGQIIASIALPFLVLSYFLIREPTILAFMNFLPHYVCVLIGLIAGYFSIVVLKKSPEMNRGTIISCLIMSVIVCGIIYGLASDLGRAYDVTMGIVFGMLINSIFNGIPQVVLPPSATPKQQNGGL